MSNKKTIFGEWKEQFKSPWNHSSFRWYFFGFIIVIGCIGIYPSIIRFFNNGMPLQDVAESIVTYSIAIIMPACVVILLSSYKTEKKVSLVVCSLLFLVVLPVALALGIICLEWQLLAIPLIILAWFSWIIANHDNDDLIDESYNEKIQNNVKKTHCNNWN